MREGIKEARSALRRGDADAALVRLWNELEPARLDGDRRSLRAIAALAGSIAQTGNESQQAEAQRLLEVTERASREGDATAALEGEMRAGGYEPGGEQREAEEAEAAGFRWGGLVWLLIFLAIVVINILSGMQD